MPDRKGFKPGKWLTGCPADLTELVIREFAVFERRLPLAVIVSPVGEVGARQVLPASVLVAVSEELEEDEYVLVDGAYFGKDA